MRKVYHAYGTRISSEWTLGFHGKAVRAIARVELKKAQSSLGCSRPVDAARGATTAPWAVVLPSGQISIGWPDIFEFRVSGCGTKISGIPKSRVFLESFSHLPLS
jgi:formylglycine-generating enzyme required for sulfatase activity